MLELVEVGILEEEDIEHATSATFNPVCSLRYLSLANCIFSIILLFIYFFV